MHLTTAFFAFSSFGVLTYATPIREGVRVNDILVLKGGLLKFDPIGGFNKTTSDPQWQTEYLANFSDDSEADRSQSSTEETPSTMGSGRDCVRDQT